MFKKAFLILILFLLTLAMSVSAEQTVWVHESKEFNTAYTDYEVKQIYRAAYIIAVKEAYYDDRKSCGYQMQRTVDLLEENGVLGYMVVVPGHVMPLVKMADGTYYGLQYLDEFCREWGERKVNHSWKMNPKGNKSEMVSISNRQGKYGKLKIERITTKEIWGEIS